MSTKRLHDGPSPGAPAQGVSRQTVCTRGERGAASLAQVVITAPVLLFTLMLIVQFGLMFHARNLAEQAAQQGVAAARRFDGTAADATTATNAFLDAAGSQTLQDRNVTITRTAQRASVDVSGNVISLVPGLHLKVAEHAESPVERYVRPVDTP